MGQSNSIENAGRSSVAEEEPRVTISPELQRKIALDFQNEKINEAWREVQLGVLQRQHQRAQVMNEATERQNAVVARELKELQARHQQLDTRIDSLRKEFDDGLLSLEYGTKILSVDLDEKIRQNIKTLPCLGPRAHWLDCQKKYALDSRPCDAYLETLEKCVTDAIVKILSS
ncbi:hypothetical protein ACA910_004964 [Epithemia clementina (nom. ined.)]